MESGISQIVTTTARWIVARAKSGREDWALQNVASQNCSVYMPRVLGKRRGIMCSQPLFGTYFFVQSLSGAWRFLTNTFGVAGVVPFGEGPATVRDEVISALRDREIDGLIVLPPPPEVVGRWKPGAQLRVKGGVFSGNIGIYQGLAPKHRERVLLDFLGRKTAVLLAPELLEAA